jgi:hypothetical protein
MWPNPRQVFWQSGSGTLGGSGTITVEPGGALVVNNVAGTGASNRLDGGVTTSLRPNTNGVLQNSPGLPSEATLGKAQRSPNPEGGCGEDRWTMPSNDPLCTKAQDSLAKTLFRVDPTLRNPHVPTDEQPGVAWHDAVGVAGQMPRKHAPVIDKAPSPLAPRPGPPGATLSRVRLAVFSVFVNVLGRTYYLGVRRFDDIAFPGVRNR